MRKNVILTALVIILISMIPSFTCTAQKVLIEPYEMWITMNQEFIKGNTTKAIIIKNNKDEKMNFTWYIENPSPASKRQNRTSIANLSWVDVEPKWCDTLPGDKAYFYIYLNIPETMENLNQSWEIWVTFELGGNGLINYEHTVRIYIDTPNFFKNSNNENLIIDQNFVVIVFSLIIFLFAAIFFYKFKNR